MAFPPENRGSSAGRATARQKALFLDRDGTIIESVPYLHEPEKVVLVPGAREALLAALEAGFHLFLLSNQSGVGRGTFALSAVEACNQRMLDLLDLPGGGFTRIGVAPEAPGQAIQYRKPSPRFILEMIADYGLAPGFCWMIGDSPCDWEAAEKAGIRAVRVGQSVRLPEAIYSILAGTGTAL